MLRQLTSAEVEQYIADDPVRPHLSAEFRTTNGRQMWGLFEDQYAVEHAPLHNPQAVICVAYTDEVPTCERDLGWVGTEIANFYTVWSYDRGAGRSIVFEVADHIKRTNPDVKRFVTLSPLTEMAKNFHLKNGAKFLRKHMDCQNFEY